MWYAVSFVLAAVVMLLAWKILQLKRSAREIADTFSERVQDRSGTAIGVSGRDRDLCRLADGLNRELLELQKIRLQCERSETELNRAVANLSHDLRTPLHVRPSENGIRQVQNVAQQVNAVVLRRVFPADASPTLQCREQQGVTSGHRLG